MKKLLFLLAALPLLCNAQSSRFSKMDLESIKLKLGSAAAKVAVSKIQDKDKTLELLNAQIDTVGNPLIKQNKDAILELTKGLGFGALYGFTYAENTAIPLVYKYNSGNVLIFDALCSVSVYNKNALSRNETAKKVVNEICIPAMCTIDEIKYQGIEYVGLIVAYTTKDFTAKYASVGLPCCILMVSPVSELHKLANCQITEQELISKSDFYLKDYELRRIEVKP